MPTGPRSRTESGAIKRELREALALPKRGPLPRAVALAPIVRELDGVLAKQVPRALAAIAAIATAEPEKDETVGARRVRLDAARYLVDRLLGSPATAEAAPGDDRSLPPVDGDGMDAALRAALGDFPEPIVQQMKRLWLDGMRATGRLAPDGQGRGDGSATLEEEERRRARSSWRKGEEAARPPRPH